jgi:hypothetical protein
MDKPDFEKCPGVDMVVMQMFNQRMEKDGNTQRVPQK